MAVGNRCYLCGGKLRRGRCIECGLDNDRMTRRNYRLNITTPYHVKQQQVAARKAENMKYIKEYKREQASLENLGKPVSQQKKSSVSRPINTPTKSNTGRTAYQQQVRKSYDRVVKDVGSRVENRKKEVESSNKKPWIGPIIALVCIFFPLLGELGGCIADVFDELSYGTEYAFSEVEEVLPQEVVVEDEYAWVTRELASDGEVYNETFGPGKYIVGVHIPEGTYQVELLEGLYVYAHLQDHENGIYISMNLGEDAYDSVTSFEDIRMYNGACLEITGDGALLLSAENAQIDQMVGMDNPMGSDTVATFYADMDENTEVIVGEDIPEGVYDLHAVNGWTSVCVSCPIEYFEESDPVSYEYYYWLDSETNENTYKNIVLIDGMTISFTDCELEIIPSAWIRDNQYEELFFEKYYY